MKAKPLRYACTGGFEYCEPEHATHIEMHFPGPMPLRFLPIVKINNGPKWTWNFDTESPTIDPSLLTSDGQNKCHSFVRNGRVEYLSDSTHEFAGQTLDLLDVK